MLLFASASVIAASRQHGLNEPAVASLAAADSSAPPPVLPPSLAQLLSAAQQDAAQQVLFFDRHVEKNGGGSMSKAMRASDECGGDTVGYSLQEKQLAPLDAMLVSSTVAFAARMTKTF